MLETLISRRAASAAAAALLILVLGGCSNSTPQEKEAKFLERGKEFLAKKEFDRAMLEFRNAASWNRTDAEPRYQMGMVALQTGNVAGAVVAFKKALELNPKHAMAQLRLGELLTVSRDKQLTEEAQKRVEQVLQATPDNAEAVDAMAIVEYRLGKPADAVKRLQGILKKFPAHLQSAIALAEVNMAQGDVKSAEAVLKQAADQAPNSSDAAVALGEFYALLKKMDLAEKEVRRAMKLNPQDPSALFMLAAIQVNANRLEEADQTYKLISQLPDARYRPTHALFLFQHGNRPAALEEFRKLAEADPLDRTARSRLVAVYAAMDRTADAEQILAAALKKNPDDQFALMQRSELYLKNNRFNEAEKDLLRLFKLQPTADVHFGLARVHHQRGEAIPERAALSAALRINPGLLAARVALARNYNFTRDPHAAIETLDAAPNSQQGSVDLLIERGWALLLLGEFREVRALTHRVLAAVRLPEAVLQEAFVKFDEKDFIGARADAEEVLTADPDDARAAHLVADTYLMQKQPAKAVESVRLIAAKRPNSNALQTLLAQLLASANLTDEAKTAFEAAKKSDPASSSADISLAGLDVANDRLADARRRLEAVVAVDGKNVRAQVLLAGLEAQMGDKKSVNRYRYVLSLDSNNLLALNNLAYLMAKDQPDAASRLAERALAVSPGNVAALDTLGWVCFRNKDYKMALRHLKAAYDREPSPIRQYHLGMAYQQTGNDPLGQKLVQEATKSDPKLQTHPGW